LTFDKECLGNKQDLLEKLSNKRSKLKGRTVSSDTIKRIRMYDNFKKTLGYDNKTEDFKDED